MNVYISSIFSSLKQQVPRVSGELGEGACSLTSYNSLLCGRFHEAEETINPSQKDACRKTAENFEPIISGA